jgi:hypothetical protein
MAANLNNTTPAAPSGNINITWQKDALGNVSGYIPSGGGTTLKYTTSWTSQTSVTVTHNLGTTAVIVQVFDGSGVLQQPQAITVTSSNVVTLTFGASFSGSVVVIG